MGRIGKVGGWTGRLWEGWDLGARGWGSGSWLAVPSGCSVIGTHTHAHMHIHAHTRTHIHTHLQATPPERTSADSILHPTPYPLPHTR